MDKSFLMPNYNPLPIEFEYGKGVWLYTDDHTPYLDAVSGIAVCSLGHAHPLIASILSEQASKLIHTSNLYQIKNQRKLAQKLTEITNSDTVFFCNSGAEANETAIKLARLYGHTQRGLNNPTIAVMRNAFHGRTLATWSASRPSNDSPFAPLLDGFVQIDFDDISQLKDLLKEKTQCCAVMLEPIQGEAGVIIPQKQYLQEVYELCNAHNVLMIVDEVQTGIGRTGYWYNFQGSDIVPDIITSAKALGNGVPIGACIAKYDIAKHLQAGTHGSTFGGNPLACAVGLEVINIIEQEGLVAHSKQMGEYLLNSLQQNLTHNIVKEIRGSGLMLAIELKTDASKLALSALDYKLLINTNNKTIRLLPPLIIQKSEIDILTECLDKLLTQLETSL